MADETRVTISQLKNQSENLTSLNSQFRKAIEELAGIEGQLMKSWDGEAKEAFHNAFHNTDRLKWEQFAKTIDEYARAMLDIYGRYSTAEQTAVTIASQRGNY